MADADRFDAYYVWLGITPEQRPASYYRLLDVRPFEADPMIIETGFNRRMAYLRTIKDGEHLELAEKLKDELTEARLCLMNPAKKKDYDADLRRRLELRSRLIWAGVAVCLTLLIVGIWFVLRGSMARGTVRSESPSEVNSATKPNGTQLAPLRPNPPTASAAPMRIVGSAAPATTPAPLAGTTPSSAATTSIAVAATPAATVQPVSNSMTSPSTTTGSGAPLRSPFKNSVGMDLVLIPAGEFEMGSIDRDEDELPVHRVRITQSFYLGTTEVTRGQWESVMATRPWDGKRDARDATDYPAIHVNWDDVTEFCKQLSVKEGRTYRLPTEAEWEYACRAGTTTTWSFGDDESRFTDYGWYSRNSFNTSDKNTHHVAKKQPNPWGLFDMHGNVDEWCSDWYAGDYYAHSPLSDPSGPATGSYRVKRGGHWFITPVFCRSSNRSRSPVQYRHELLGFRVVMVP